MDERREDEFGFDDEAPPGHDEFGESPLFIEAAEEEPFTPELEDGQSQPQERKSSVSRLLLLVLILVAGAAALFFSFAPTDEPPVAQTPPAATKKQPIASPSPPEQPAQQVAPAAATAVPAEKVAQPEAPAAPAPVTPTPESQSAVEETPVAKPQETVSAAAPRPVERPAEVAPAISQAKPQAPAAGPKYRILAGAFLQHSHLTDAERRIEGLGYPVRVVPVKRRMSMTRLKLGTYPAAEARSRLAELQAAAPEAFLVAEGGKLAVYAGSFSSPQQARSAAAELLAQGWEVRESAAEVEVSLQQLSCGPFTGYSSAKSAAERIRDAGLAAMVIRSQDSRR